MVIPWLYAGKAYIGLKEIPGKQHNPVIRRWLIELNARWHDDETPWCGTFVAFCFRAMGYPIPKHWYRALAWQGWGKEVPPQVGAVAVMRRNGGGHVGIVYGFTDNGDVLLLGGNQSNAVNIKRFPKERIISYRMPLNYRPESLQTVYADEFDATEQLA